MESRGNRKYVKDMESTLHFGQLFNSNHESVPFGKHDDQGFDKAFHKYELIWNDGGIQFLVDGDELGSVPVKDGYWKQGNFTGENHWASGSKMAPFDQEVGISIYIQK